MAHDWERAELAACLMVAMGCRVASVLDAFMFARRARDAAERLF